MLYLMCNVCRACSVGNPTCAIEILKLINGLLQSFFCCSIAL